MIRFLHSSDWHLTAGKFFDETVAVLEFLTGVARREKVDAVLLPGDFVHADLPHRVMVPRERLWIADLLGKRGLPAVHIIHGNHDIECDLDLFGLLPNVRVHTGANLSPVVRVVPPDSSRDYDLLTVPYPHKRHWQAARAAGSIEGGRQELGATLGQALRGLAQQRRPDVPLIGLAHLNIAGSKVGGGEVLIGQEIELSPADLDEIGCDYWALGHIHAPQQIAERAWYAGTPQPHSFGDSNVNGFNLVEIEGPGKPPRVTFVETPAVKLVTDHVLWANGAWVHNTDDCALAGQPVGRVHLRVVATVDEADRDAARWGDLDRWGHAFAPLSVKIERRIIPTTRVRSEAIRAASSVPEKLAAFWDTQTPSPPADERERAVELLEVIA